MIDNPVYVEGLKQPLEVVAETLEAQGKEEFARALRDAAKVCALYATILESAR